MCRAHLGRAGSCTLVPGHSRSPPPPCTTARCVPNQAPRTATEAWAPETPMVTDGCFLQPPLWQGLAIANWKACLLSGKQNKSCPSAQVSRDRLMPGKTAAGRSPGSLSSAGHSLHPPTPPPPVTVTHRPSLTMSMSPHLALNIVFHGEWKCLERGSQRGLCYPLANPKGDLTDM